MKIFYVTLLMFCGIAYGFGSISGVVTSHGEILQMGNLIVKPNNYRGYLNQNGEFYIDSIPPGNYNIHFHMMDITLFAGIPFSIVEDENLFIQMELDPAATPQWPEYPDTHLDTLVFEFADGLNEGFQVWADSLLIVTEISDDSTLLAFVPKNATVIGYSLPGTAEVVLPELDDTEDTVIYVAGAGINNRMQSTDILPLDPHEYLNHNFTLERDCIDLSRWGDDDLVNFGFIGLEVLFLDSMNPASPRFYLFYRDRLIILDETFDVIRYKFPFPIRTYNISRNGLYVSVFQDIGFEFQGGDVAVISLESGEIAQFDPTPEREEPDSWVTSAFGSERYTYSILNSGEVLKIFDGSMLILTHKNGRAISTEVLNECISPDYDIVTGLNDENTTWFCAEVGDLFILTEFNNAGEILNQYELLEEVSQFNRVIMFSAGYPKMCFYSDLSVIYQELLFGEFPLIMNELDGENIIEFQISPNSEYLAYLTSTQSGYYPIISSLVERTSVSFEFSRDWNFCYLRGLSDTGRLFSLYENASSREYPSHCRLALFAPSNELIWVGPTRRLQPILLEQDWQTPVDALSPDGTTLVYLDGSVINVLRIKL